MHDRADLAHGLVDGCQRVVDQGLDGLGISLSLGDLLLGGVQGHTGREELLDREVVQIAPDAITLVEQGGHVLGVARGGQLEGQRRLGGQRFGEGKLGGIELGSPDLSQEDEHAGGDTARAQGSVERGAKGCQLGDPHGLGARH